MWESKGRKMKIRPRGFLTEGHMGHESEIFDYIGELHRYLWRFVYCVLPGASGRLEDYIDIAIRELEYFTNLKKDFEAKSCVSEYAKKIKDDVIKSAQKHILYSFANNAISCEEACEQLKKLLEGK